MHRVSQTTRRVLVAGAGPAGSAAAMALAKRPGIETILVDRARFPRTKVCGSGLSPWTLTYLDQLGVGNSVRKRAMMIKGARIAGTRDRGVELRGHHETAVLVRKEFDQLLVEEATRRGVDFRDGVKITKLHDLGGSIGVDCEGEQIEVDAVIDASGARGKLTPGHRSGKTLHTIVGWYEGVADVSDVVELFFDRTVKPHYGWIFPESTSRVNIGICFDPSQGQGNARQRFEAFLDGRLRERLRFASRLSKWVGHPAHTSPMPKSLVKNRLLVAGEAGRLVDAATAEGIFHGLVSGTLAGRHLARLFSNRIEPTARALVGYQRQVQRALMVRQLGGAALMEALRTPVLDAVLRFQNHRLVQTALRRAFTGLYHG